MAHYDHADQGLGIPSVVEQAKVWNRCAGSVTPSDVLGEGQVEGQSDSSSLLAFALRKHVFP